MQVTNDFNPDNADALALQIEELIKENSQLTQAEILAVGMMIIGDVLASIQCRDCRALSADSVKEKLPQVITHALRQPIRHDQQHVH